MAAIAELQYRTFDSLLDSVRLDLTSWQQTGDIDSANLIKVAQKVNYELGLKIYMAKETIIDVEHKRGKLPADFHQLQLALLCHNYRNLYYPVGPGANGALQLYEQVLPPNSANPNLTTCPCWTVTSTGVQATVHYCDGTTASVYFPAETDGTAKTTKICALSIVQANASGILTAVSKDFCYNDPDTGSFTCTPPLPACAVCTVPASALCGAIDADPFHTNRVRSICEGDINIKVIQGCGTPGKVRCFEQFERIYITPSRYVSSFCNNDQFSGQCKQAQIKGKFIETTVDCGRMYIQYLGGLEDDDGNLLVLDHPKINFYYESELMYTILRNLYVNGEPDIERRLALLKQERDDYRDMALSIINMPDFRQCLCLAQTTRQLMNQRYMDPFNRYFGHIGYIYNRYL